MCTNRECRPKSNGVPLPVAKPTLRSEVMLRLSDDHGVRRGWMEPVTADARAGLDEHEAPAANPGEPREGGSRRDKEPQLESC